MFVIVRHRWEHCRLLIHARIGWTRAIERSDLLERMADDDGAVRPHDNMNLCCKAVAPFQSSDGSVGRDLDPDRKWTIL